MLIYLDMCVIQRPFDDQSQLRVRLEAAASLGLLDHCRVGAAVLAGSDALVFEAARNPDPARRAYAEAVLKQAASRQPATPEVEARAQELTATGFGPLDALHLASAEAMGADYFYTCDDRLLRKARANAVPPTRVFSPIELTTELGL